MVRIYDNRKRILVTGGAGFLGSHLCDRLLAQGHEVLCVDNLFTGTKRNIDHLHNHPRFELMRHDVTFPLFVEVDEIYNLACPASPIHYQHDPVQTTKTSVHGAINMLGLAKRLRCRILQASTSEVYGDPRVHPQTEDYWGHVNPIGPRSCYDEGKRCAETLFFDYHRQNKVAIKVARIFNTYGPRMHPRDGRVVSNFIIQALDDQDITIYGNGEQSRSFCYVDDLVEGLILLMNSDSTITGPINLGNPVEFTIRQLAELVIRMTGSASSLDTVLQEGREIVNKANKRHVIVRNADGTKLVELSATMLAVAVVLMFFFQPFGTIVAIAGLVYGIYSKVKIEVVHELGDDETMVEVNLPQDDE